MAIMARFVALGMPLVNRSGNDVPVPAILGCDAMISPSEAISCFGFHQKHVNNYTIFLAWIPGSIFEYFRSS